MNSAQGHKGRMIGCTRHHRRW